jgi:hypothetical protein
METYVELIQRLKIKTELPYGMKLLDNYTTCSLRKAGFFRQLADDSLIAFEKVRFASWYPEEAMLFAAGQVPRGVHMLCQGQVKLTIASPGGKRLLCGSRKPVSC